MEYEDHDRPEWFMKKLWPPLKVIESDLFDPSYGLIQRWSDDEKTLPAEMLESLEQNVNAQTLRQALRNPS